MRTAMIVISAAALWASTPPLAAAQTLGTFRWQLQPYCNVIAVAVTQVGGVYRVEGTDDQCGGGRDLAAVQGLAFPNPDGTIGFGLTLVTTPGGAPLHVDADLSIATLNGTWRDSASNSGTFAFGASTGGSPRPLPSSLIPGTIRLLPSGSVLAEAVPGQPAPIPTEGAGRRLMWHAGKAAFRAGRVIGTQWNDANIGDYSAAFGVDTRASGLAATAFGSGTLAGGEASTALGGSTLAGGRWSTAAGRMTSAGGDASTALGSGTVASGAASTAMGATTSASGAASVAFGRTTTAIGDESAAFGEGTAATAKHAFALGAGSIAGGTNSLAGGFQSLANGREALAFGTRVLAGGDGSVVLGSDAVTQTSATGSILFGDRSTTTAFTATAPNEFGVRAAGGTYIYSSASLGSGVSLAPGGSSWAALSDVNAKENFRDVDGELVLAKLAAMPIREWNYKAQDAALRHLGPTAQDFRAAFGLGDFPLRINTIDADGVALAGVKALDARTRAMQDDHAALRAELAAADAQVAALRDELRRLQSQMAGRY